MLWITSLLREGLRAARGGRGLPRGRVCRALHAVQSRQLVQAECSVYVQYSRCMRGLLVATILLRRASGLLQQTLRPVRLQSRQPARRRSPAVLSR